MQYVGLVTYNNKESIMHVMLFLCDILSENSSVMIHVCHILIYILKHCLNIISGLRPKLRPKFGLRPKLI